MSKGHGQQDRDQVRHEQKTKGQPIKKTGQVKVGRPGNKRKSKS